MTPFKEMASDESQNSSPFSRGVRAYSPSERMVETLKGCWGVYAEPPCF